MINNTVFLVGRLTRDVELRYAQNESNMAIARYSLAIDQGKDKDAIFINCTCFGKLADFSNKYFAKGTKVIVKGHLNTSSYTKEDGTKVYSTDVIVDEQTFAESKSASQQNANSPIQMPIQIDEQLPPPSGTQTNLGDWMNIPNDIDESLPFN